MKRTRGCKNGEMLNNRVLKIAVLLLFSTSAHGVGLEVNWEPFIHSDCDIADPAKVQFCTAGYNLYRATPNFDSPWLKLNDEGLIVGTEWVDETVWGWTRYYYIAEAISMTGAILQTSAPKCIVHVCHGDVNESYTITVSDAALIAQYLVGLIELSGNALKAADANLDKSVTISDAARIHLHIVGIMSLEHCP